MSKLQKLAISLALILGFANHAIAEERDPFSPSSVAIGKIISGDKKEESGYKINGLTANKIETFRLTGVLIGKDKKVAAIKAINGQDFFVSEGDFLGSNGGKITEIDVDGILVKEGNDQFKIPVQNKIEVTADKEK